MHERRPDGATCIGPPANESASLDAHDGVSRTLSSVVGCAIVSSSGILAILVSPIYAALAVASSERLVPTLPYRLISLCVSFGPLIAVCCQACLSRGEAVVRETTVDDLERLEIECRRSNNRPARRTGPTHHLNRDRRQRDFFFCLQPCCRASSLLAADAALDTLGVVDRVIDQGNIPQTANFDIALPSGYDEIEIGLYGFGSTVSGVGLNLQVSTDGSTFLSSSYSYAGNYVTTADTTYHGYSVAGTGTNIPVSNLFPAGRLAQLRVKVSRPVGTGNKLIHAWMDQVGTDLNPLQLNVVGSWLGGQAGW
ncbi:hypothetical protein [Bradyrhizobium sp. USDA 3458]|uniref:hypothetical protein n=1 Tax=Bradyrhizobium sp. USDA 3458 TaxID=2591461 RepID=UPI0011418DE4|nr:hypothetical protein [Bradyrhizobium sp. USDA 3458]